MASGPRCRGISRIARLQSVTENSLAANPSDRRVTTYGYTDPSNPEDVTVVTDPEGKEWTFDHDPDTGQQISQSDPLGNISTSVFNDAGWLTSAVSPPATRREVFPRITRPRSLMTPQAAP